MPDVLIRPTGGGPCTRRALQRAASVSLLGSPRLAAAAAVADSPAAAAARYVSEGVVERTAREIVGATWCLCPAGDTCVTSRLYTAIAAGCLPVVLCDQLQGAFASSVRYADFWLRVPVRTFLAEPSALVPLLRRLSANDTEMGRRQRALARARADLLYDVPGSRAGSHFLEAVVRRCLPHALLDDALSRTANHTDAREAFASMATCLRRPAGSGGGSRARRATGRNATVEDARVCLRRAGHSLPAGHGVHSGHVHSGHGKPRPQWPVAAVQNGSASRGEQIMTARAKLSDARAAATAAAAELEALLATNA